MDNLIKNIRFSKVLDLRELVKYSEGQVISMTIALTPSVSITLFSLDKGEGISAHTTDGDAMVQVLDGKASITIGNKNFAVNSGETIIMPSGIQHALQAVEKFKMLLTVVKH